VTNSDKIVWPHLYTCPAWTRLDLRRNDLGETIFNPVFSDREKLLRAPGGCLDCDYTEECRGPIEYAPTGVVGEGGKVKKKKPRPMRWFRCEDCGSRLSSRGTLRTCSDCGGDMVKDASGPC
jgi:hypothetical protein